MTGGFRRLANVGVLFDEGVEAEVNCAPKLGRA